MKPDPYMDASHKKLRVLILDDNDFARSVARRVLKSAGIVLVEEAASAEAALDELRRPARALDLIFCDLVMPDMDGVEFIRHVARLPNTPAFVFVSAADTGLLQTAGDTARARGLRVLGTISKPLSVEAVTRILPRLASSETVDPRLDAANIPASDFKAALAEGEFILHYQPKFALADNVVVGFESLLRWQHPKRGLISPAGFIPLAERSGEIAALTDHVTTMALRQSAIWAKSGFHTKISVNLSAYMLVDLDLPDRMAAEARRFDIEPQQLILEITESGLLHDSPNTLDILARLHLKGFPLSIDDFGTGYSSLEQLRRIPFAEMKIDRAFVRGAAENPKASAILMSSASLGRSLGISVVAEGAETHEDIKGLRDAGVDVVQGYFIAKPMPADDVPHWRRT